MLNRLLLFVALVAAVACSKPQLVELETPEVTLTAEGPLFDGANTASGNWEIDLAQRQIDPQSIQSARVKSIVISCDSVADLSLLRDITFQITGEGVNMQRVAVLNPVPQGASSLELVVADEQEEIAALLKLPALTLVADVNFTGDRDENLVLKAKVVFEIETN
jgi:hypothetical protein